MINGLLRHMLIGLFVLLSMTASTQTLDDGVDRTAEDFVTVSLVICDPSEVLYSTLGHAALHLQCPTFDLDYIFTYESESVRDKVWTFLKGNLRMGMFAMLSEDFLQTYAEEGRGVREYMMYLSPEQEQRLWAVMDKHVAEGIDLPYDYFHRGCAKSVVQVVHEAIGKHAIHYAPWPDKYTRQTQRELVRNYITDAPWQEFEMYFLIGVDGDKPYPSEQKLIVPDDLVEVWQQATLDSGQPMLSSEAHVFFESTRPLQGTWCTPLLVSIVLLLLSISSLAVVRTKSKGLYIAGKVVDYAILGIMTALGAVMTYLIVFSGLPCTDWNWLIIPFNILPILAWYWRRYWALPYAGIIVLWCAVMACELLWGHVLVDWPHILLALSFAVLLLKRAKS